MRARTPVEPLVMKYFNNKGGVKSEVLSAIIAQPWFPTADLPSLFSKLVVK